MLKKDSVNKMTKYFDARNNRLVFIEKKANPRFWDKLWLNKKNRPITKITIANNDFVLSYTRKFLRRGSRILEGGCGLGHYVYALSRSGYRCIGIDSAESTVRFVKKINPLLDIRAGDVRKMRFRNNSFDGYWSLGVIEHFYVGYDAILQEMSRTVKRGGSVFVTFPHMSLVRRVKAVFGLYPKWTNRKSLQDKFYQFALSEKSVIKDFERYNLRLVDKKNLDGIKGLKDEVKFLKPLLQKVYDSKSKFINLVSHMLSILLNNFSSHSKLLVFRNEK